MKFLEIPNFQALSTFLSSIKSADLIIHGHIEAYSCKRAGGDKKLYRSLERRYSSENQNHESDNLQESMETEENTPTSLLTNSFEQDPEDFQHSSSPHSLSLSLTPHRSPSAAIVSPFGSLIESSSRHTFISLISTLNASFPDYDFSSLKPEEFTKEHLSTATTRINNLLMSCLPDQQAASDIIGRTWLSLEAEIHLKECDIYAYIPEPDFNPFVDDGDDDEPCLWMYNYFFYNKKLKRIVFFHLRAVRNQKFHSYQGNDDMDLFD